MKQKLHLITFPYAGGSSVIYTNWKRLLEPEIKVHSIEFPGKGKNIQFKCLESIDAMVEFALQEMEDMKVFNSSYALFGHSMGGIIIYEFMKRIAERNIQKPTHVFISGKSPLHIPQEKKNMHDLDDEQFKVKLLELGGTDEEVLKNEELFLFFTPILRADFKAVELYEFKDPIQPFSVPLTVFYGKDDEECIQDIEEWSQYSTNRCTFHQITGNHFFIHTEYPQIIQIIKNTV